MVEVTGKTIAELDQKTSLEGNYKFLGASGSGLTYSTWTTTYNTLMRDISAGCVAAVPGDVNNRINELYRLLGDRGKLFNKEDSAQTVNVNTTFNNSVVMNGAISCQGQTILTNNTYRGSAAAGNRFVTSSDVDAAIQSIEDEFVDGFEQILDMSYADYQSNGVKVTPVYNNNSCSAFYSTEMKEKTFYRYAAIRGDIPPNATTAAGQAAVYKQTGGFVGLPLTKAYDQFRTLTIVCIGDSSPTSGTGSAQKIYCVSFPAQSVVLARRYSQYKSIYKRSNGANFFANVTDKWYFNDYAGEIVYIDTKPGAKFDKASGDKCFLPVRFKTSGFCAVAVFGQK